MTATAKDIVLFFFYLDKDEELFPYDKIVTINNKQMYEGNVRINKYLHIAQNLYIAKFGKPLFKDDMYAYTNGAIVKDVQLNYQILKMNHWNENSISEQDCTFLKQVFNMLKNASIEELINISHEDPEWEEKVVLPRGRQKMDSFSRLSLYKQKYDGALYVLEKMCSYE